MPREFDFRCLVGTDVGEIDTRWAITLEHCYQCGQLNALGPILFVKENKGAIRTALRDNYLRVHLAISPF